MFIFQVLFQMSSKLIFGILGLPILAVACLFTRRPREYAFDTTNFRYPIEKRGIDVVCKHRADYIAKGASGLWIYERLPDWGFITRPFDNLNYGLRGELTGKWSAHQDGKEHTWWAMFKQAAFRNPVNGFRYMDAFSCQVDNCYIYYTGSEGPLGRRDEGIVEGWNFVKGVDRETDKKYYSFQWVKQWNEDRMSRIRIGFKIEPSHKNRGDLPVDKERATFTVRLNPWLDATPLED